MKLYLLSIEMNITIRYAFSDFITFNNKENERKKDEFKEYIKFFGIRILKLKQILIQFGVLYTDYLFIIKYIQNLLVFK